MSKIKLIYDNYCTWEKDYIIDLFNIINFDTIYVEPEILKNKLENENEIINNNILVFSSTAYTFNQIMDIVLRIKPLIIVHLSDEFGNRPEYTHLASQTKLLLHQHYFNHYPYNNYRNIIQIPLGYMTGMFNNKNSLDFKHKSLLERKYKWSFIGNVKQDRLEIIDKFSKKFNEKFVGNNITLPEMLNIYNDSIFVPNGRGNNRVDCFRIYEAILSGSIPIIVCDETEFNNTFYYNNDIPPFILEKTWDNAVNRCEYLLNNIEELKIIQEKNYDWLQKKITSIQEIVYNICLLYVNLNNICDEFM
jgi:hypothetical protein